MTPERNDLFPRPVVALLIHRFQPYTFRRRLNRASPPCRARGARLTDGATRACRGEDPVPEYSGERGERLGLHPHTPDGGATAPARAIPGQDACCTVLSRPNHFMNRGPMIRLLNATGHEGRIGG